MNKLSGIIWAGHVISIGEMRNEYDIFCRKNSTEEATWKTRT
jgi:hypothetical protein